MKRALRVLPVIALFAAGSMLIAAQDTDSAAAKQDEKPQMAMVYVAKVKPSMIEQYEEATRDMCEMLTEHGADPSEISFFTISGPEMGYAFVMPLADGFNSMESTKDGWMSTIQSIGMERWMEMSARADECVESHSMIHSVYREDLSYAPEKPALKQEDIKFAHYTWLYTYPGQEEAFAEISKEWSALYAKHNIANGWRVYQQITGEDLPVFMIIEVARSEAEYRATEAKIQETLGEEAEALMNRSEKVIRKMERKIGFPRPDLSYPTMTGE